MKTFLKIVAALAALLVVGIVMLIWGLAPTTKEFNSSEALQLLERRLKIDIHGPAKGIARHAWPGERTQYFQFSLSIEAIKTLQEQTEFKVVSSCSIEGVPKLIEPPEWFLVPSEADEIQVFVNSNQIIWYNTTNQKAFLFSSSVEHGCGG